MKPNDLVNFAAEFATLAHEDAGQRYDGKPYREHLEQVVNVLLRFGEVDKTLLAAGYLHDVVEDVGIKLSTIEDLFGPSVTALVTALTDEPGSNRKERKAKTYPKIRAAGTAAIQLKLADRIANVENGIMSKNMRMFLMYKKEHPEFEKNLRDSTDPEVLNNMWNHLAYLFKVGESRLLNTLNTPVNV